MSVKNPVRVSDTEIRYYKCGCIYSGYYGMEVVKCMTHKKTLSTHGKMRYDLAKAGS